MESIIYKEWRDQNSSTSFPFIYNNNEINNSYFVDASLSVSGAPIVWLSYLEINSSKISGELTDSGLNKFYFGKNIENDSSGESINIVNIYDKISGKIVLGNFFNNTKLFNKSFFSRFNDKDILLNPTCIFSYSNKHLNSIQINSKDIVRGFISFQEGPGVEINGQNNIIIFDALGKQASNFLQNDCECQNENILKKLNNVVSSNPNFSIKQKDIGQPSNTINKRQVIRVNAIDNGIVIELTK
jgi:hypothetical protein